MVSDFAVRIAGTALAKAAELRPASVQNNASDRQVILAWAEAVEMMNAPQIIEVWAEAVTWWSLNAPTTEMFTPYALRHAVLQTVERWERDTDRRHELEQYRYDRLCERVRRGELPPGTEVGHEPQLVREARPDAISAPPGAVKQISGWRDRMRAVNE